jgi:hypothetical protein
MSNEVSESWDEGGNIRRPITLKTEEQFDQEMGKPINNQNDE